MAVAKFEMKAEARKALKCSAYKVMDYLVDRADGRGVSYPHIATIADDCGMDPKTAENALSELAVAGYAKYLQKGERCALTGRQLGNVYQVSPDYIILSNEEAARQLWDSVADGKNSHLQESLTNSNTKTNTRTSLLNQTCLLSGYMLDVVTPPSIDDDIDSESEKDSENESDDLPLFKFEREMSAASQMFGELAAAGRSYEQTEPEPVDNPAPRFDFVDRLALWGIEPHQTRNFVAKHGPELVNKAIEGVRTAEYVSNPAGLFVHLLRNPQKIEKRPSDPIANLAADNKRYAAGKYAWAVQA